VESATRATTVQGLRGDASAAAADPLPVVSKLSSLSTGSTELVENREKRCSEKEDCSLSSNERSTPEDATLLAGTLDLAPHLVTVASPPPTTNKQTNKQTRAIPETPRLRHGGRQRGALCLRLCPDQSATPSRTYSKIPIKKIFFIMIIRYK